MDNASGDGGMEGDHMATFQERIAPHELNDGARQDYLRALWKEFAESASRGYVSLFEAKRIAEELRVDGEEDFLDENTTDHEKGNIPYSRLVRLLDDMGRSSTEEYRDIDLEKVDASDGQHVVHMGPIDYLVHHCSKEKGVTAKLQLWTGEITPKQLLLVSTGTLMLLICVAIILGMSFMWSGSARTREENSLKAFHESVLTLFEAMEFQILKEHTLSMVDQAVVLAMWTERLLNEEIAISKHEAVQVADRGLQFLSVGVMHGQATVSSRMQAEVLRDLNDLGVTASSVPKAATAMSNTGLTLTSELCDERAALLSRSELVHPSFVNNSWVCPSISTKDGQGIAATIARRVASLVTSADTVAANATATHFLVLHQNIVTTHQDHCINLDGQPLCQDISNRFGRLDNRTVSGEARALLNQTYTLGAAQLALPVGHLVLAYGQPLNSHYDRVRWRTVDIVNHLNFNFIRSTEIVVSLWNETTKSIIRQATEFRFADGCLFPPPRPCDRFNPSSRNIIRAFEKRDYGWAITPDYRPEPVVGAYSYVGAGLNMAIVLERDVIELRGISFGIITEIINTVNRDNVGSLELEMAGFQGMPLMKQFYAYEPCPTSVTDCFVDPRGIQNVNGSNGLIFRWDCQHCQRVTEFQHDNLILYQAPKKLLTAAEPGSSSSVTSASESTPIAAPYNYRERLLGATSGLAYQKDYHGDDVVLAWGYVDNYTTLLTAKVDQSEVTGPINRAIGISVACGIGFLIVGMLLLVGLSHKAFDAIEAEWSSYKRSIEREQAKFANLVRGIIPPAVAERLMRGSKIISDNVPTASFVFVDVCAFNDITRQWSPKHTARFMTYCITVMDEVSAECEMTKLRCVGSTYVCVGLREDKHRATALLHPACRAARFASLLMILFSKVYSHYPQHTKNLRDVFKDAAKDQALEMPLLRVGIHCGPSVSGAFTIGKTSHYDFFGISPALAHRMQQTAQP